MLLCLFVLCQLEEQLSTAIDILNQALQVTEDMLLPKAPPLLSNNSKKIEQTGQEKSSDSSAAAFSEEGTETREVDVADNNKSEDDAKNGSEDCNGADTVEQVDTTTEEVVKVKKEDIIAQVFAYMKELLGVFF